MRRRLPITRDLRYRLEYALLRLVVGAVRLFPLDTASWLSGRVWRLLAPHGRRHRRALGNLARAFPEMSEAERERIARAMWENLGKVMAETMQLDRILAEPERIENASERVLARYRGRAGAIIGVTLHMGNWELAAWPLTAIGARPAAIYRLVKNPYVDRYLREQRRDLYPGGLLAKGKAHGSNEEGRRTARQIMDYVRRGGRLGIVADLYDKKGVPVPFFGHPARSTPVPAMLARRTGARIFVARCLRVGGGVRFRIEAEEIRVPRSRNQGDDIRWITAEIQRRFETWVRETPEQWMWSNRKWE